MIIMKDDFPLLKKWYEISDWLMDRAEKFPKIVRFTFSNRIVNLTLNILEKITQAVYEEKRLAILQKISSDIEKLRILIRLAKDRHYLSISQYKFISQEINEAGKMLGGWIKSEKKKVIK